MYDHTKPSALYKKNNLSPFYRWLQTFADKDINGPDYRFRVIGPVSDERALIWERALIIQNFDTVFNVFDPINKVALRPVDRAPRTGDTPRSERGWAKFHRDERRALLGHDKPLVKSGSGIRRHGPSWRVTTYKDGVATRKTCKTYCEALQYRKAHE